MNALCYLFKVQEKRQKSRKKRKKKKETFTLETVCRGNIADPYKYLFGPWLLKPYYILNVPSCRNLFIVLFAYGVPFFCMFLFSFIRFNLFSLNVLLAFKNITREIGIVDYDQIIISYLNLEAHIFRYPGGGRKTKWPGVCLTWNLETPCQRRSVLPQVTPPTLSTSSHMPEKVLLTRTYFARDQVPDCPDLTRAKNKLPSWDKYFWHRHIWLTYKNISSIYNDIKRKYSIINILKTFFIQSKYRK